jgi:flagellin FlaB
MKKVLRGERGITGLETAIILIAFVIVASVFAFVTLSTGLFSAERSKETIFAGLAKAQSNLELHGSVVIDADLNDDGDADLETTDVNGDGDTNDLVDGNITFQLALAAGGSPISLDRTADNSRVVTNFIGSAGKIEDVYYNVTPIVGDADELLEPGELFSVRIRLTNIYDPNNDGTPDDPDGTGPQTGDGTDFTLSPNEKFSIEVVAPAGGSMLIARTMPPAIDPVVDLH